MWCHTLCLSMSSFPGWSHASASLVSLLKGKSIVLSVQAGMQELPERKCSTAEGTQVVESHSHDGESLPWHFKVCVTLKLLSLFESEHCELNMPLPPNSYVEYLTPSISECDIWRKYHCTRNNKVVGEGVEKREPVSTADGNVDLYSHCRKQYGGSSNN